MTVCIASICTRAFKGKTSGLVMVADSMISMADMAADSLAFKMSGFSLDVPWITMFSGNDVSSVNPILREVGRSLREQHKAGIPLGRRIVIEAFTKAYREELRVRIESRVLAKYDYTLSDFKARALSELGPDAYARKLFEIEQTDLDVEFLIAGFDERKQPTIFVVGKDGEVVDHNVAGFWAIGSGQTSALGYLFSRKGSFRYQALPCTVYELASAKFHAETAPGVGQETSGAILYPDGTRLVIQPPQMQVLKDQWLSERRMSTSIEAQEIAKTVLKDSERGNRSSAKRIAKKRAASNRLSASTAAGAK